MIGLALRTIVRYCLPLAIVTAIVVGPIAYVAFRAPWPRDLVTANAALRFAIVLAGLGWACTIVLVAGAAPLVRGAAATPPLSNPRALVAALANLVRMAIPCLAALAAIVIGGLALALPALVLLVMLSMTGASEERGMPAPLLDSARVARRQLTIVIAIVVTMLVVDAALVVVAWKFFTVPFAKKLKPEAWATYGNVARAVAIGHLSASPLFATLLAVVRQRS